jgi:RIO kinase 1
MSYDYDAKTNNRHVAEALYGENKKLNQQERVLDKSKVRIKDKADRATVEQVLDPRTRMILFKLMRNGLIKQVNGCVSTGKEANVYHAISEQYGEIAIKVYKTSILVFKDRDRYVSGEYRFRNGYSRSNPRKMVKLWAEKEVRNLKRLHAAGIPCPEPIIVRSNVLVMKFIGQDGYAAPRIKDAEITSTRQTELYLQCIQHMRALYHVCRLVHADLSEYNMLYMSKLLYIIDVSQSVEHDHPNAYEFLRMDCANVNRYFGSKGVLVLSNSELYKYIITNLFDIPNPTQDPDLFLDSLLDQAMLREQRGGFTQEEQVAEDVFQQAYIPRTLDEIEDFEGELLKTQKAIKNAQKNDINSTGGIGGGTNTEINALTNQLQYLAIHEVNIGEKIPIKLSREVGYETVKENIELVMREREKRIAELKEARKNKTKLQLKIESRQYREQEEKERLLLEQERKLNRGINFGSISGIVALGLGREISTAKVRKLIKSLPNYKNSQNSNNENNHNDNDSNNDDNNDNNNNNNNNGDENNQPGFTLDVMKQMFPEMELQAGKDDDSDDSDDSDNGDDDEEGRNQTKGKNGKKNKTPNNNIKNTTITPGSELNTPPTTRNDDNLNIEANTDVTRNVQNVQNVQNDPKNTTKPTKKGPPPKPGSKKWIEMRKLEKEQEELERVAKIERIKLHNGLNDMDLPYAAVIQDKSDQNGEKSTTKSDQLNKKSVQIDDKVEYGSKSNSSNGGGVTATLNQMNAEAIEKERKIQEKRTKMAEELQNGSNFATKKQSQPNQYTVLAINNAPNSVVTHQLKKQENEQTVIATRLLKKSERRELKKAQKLAKEMHDKLQNGNNGGDGGDGDEQSLEKLHLSETSAAKLSKSEQDKMKALMAALDDSDDDDDDDDDDDSDSDYDSDDDSDEDDEIDAEALFAKLGLNLDGSKLSPADVRKLRKQHRKQVKFENRERRKDKVRKKDKKKHMKQSVKK